MADTEFIEPFTQGTIMVLQALAGVDVRKESLSATRDSSFAKDISALIAIESDTLTGSMIVSFEEQCFVSIANLIVSEKHTSINPQISDAATEISNQILGIAKRRLNKTGHTIKPALPKLIIGKNQELNHLIPDGHLVCIRFGSDYGLFCVEIRIKKKDP